MKESILTLGLRAILWKLTARLHGMRVITKSGTVYNGVTDIRITSGYISIMRGSWEEENLPLETNVPLDIEMEV